MSKQKLDSDWGSMVLLNGGEGGDVDGRKDTRTHCCWD